MSLQKIYKSSSCIVLFLGIFTEYLYTQKGIPFEDAFKQSILGKIIS
jgi:hypothetical protein